MKKLIYSIAVLFLSFNVFADTVFCNLPYGVENKIVIRGYAWEQAANGVFSAYGAIHATVHCEYIGITSQNIGGISRTTGETWSYGYDLTAGNSSGNVYFYPNGGVERIYFATDFPESIAIVGEGSTPTSPLPGVSSTFYLVFSDTQESIVPDADADGIPDISYLLDNATNAAAIYYGNIIMHPKISDYNTIAEVFDANAGIVECWPDRSALSAAKINENSRSITWHCILFDEQEEAYRDTAGEVVIFPVVPEWRKFQEDYD